MPDSIPPPPWGFPPFDERDLDSLLSGSVSSSDPAGFVSPALRQVADTLAALRAAPSPAELRGEAGIRAEFRAVAEFRALGRSGAATPRDLTPRDLTPRDLTPRDLTPRDVASPRHGIRRHGRRDQAPPRARPGGRLVVAALAAAALVIAVTAAYADNLPGPARHLAHVAIAALSGANRTSPSEDAKSSRAVAGPKHSAATGSPAATPGVLPSARETPAGTAALLCDAFYTSLEHPSPGQPWWEAPAYKRVSAAAGGSDRVPAYCAAEWAKLRPHDYPQVPVYHGAGSQGTGSQGTGSQGTGSQGTAKQGTAKQGTGSQGTVKQGTANQATG